MYHILYVDDEKHLTDIGKTYLEFSGEFSVDTFRSAKDALKSIEIQGYDAIIADYEMPGINGIAFLKEVRSRFGNIPFILFTGRGREEVVIEALNNGADFYLQKGGDPEALFVELRHKINIAILHRRAAEQVLVQNRLYSVLCATNKAIVHIRNKTGIFSEICRILVEIGGFRMVWIGLEDGEKKRIMPVASYGHEEGYLEGLDISTEDVPRGRGPTGTAFRTGVDYFINDIRTDPRMEPWRDAALARGYLANAAFPFGPGTGNAGVISLYAPKKGFFTEEVVGLLREMSEDISFALRTIDDENQRKTAEEALRESQTTLTAIVESTPDLIWSVDSESFALLEFNQSLARYILRTRKMQLRPGMLTEDIFPSQDYIRQWYGFYRRALTEGPFTIEYGVMAGNCILHLSFNTLRRDGSIFGISIFGKDITEQKRAEKQIRESEAFSREVINGAKEGIIVYDADLKITLWNHFMEKLTGLSASAVLGKKALELFPFHRKSGVALLLEGALTGTVGVSDAFEFTIAETGISGWSKGIYSPHYGADGSIVGVIGIIQDITERRKTEEALSESDELLREIFNNASDAIMLIENAPEGPGRFLMVNFQSTRMLGYTSEELLGMSPRDIVPVEVMEKIRPKMAQQFFHDGFAVFESVYQRKDGSTFPVEVSIHRFPYKGKDVALSIVRDSTERKNAEKALRESEERFRSVIENIQDALYRADPGGHITFASPSLAKFLDYASADELIGTDIARTFYSIPGEREKFLREIRKTGSVHNYPVSLRKPDGSIIEVETSSHLMYDESGGILGIEGVIRDVTERNRIEKSIKESEQQYRELFEHSVDIIYTLDFAGVFTSISPAAIHLGYVPEDVTGRSMQEFITPASFERAKTEISKKQEQGQKTSRYEIEIRAKDGSFFTYEVNSRIRYREGKPVDILGIARDVSHNKEAEKIVRENEELLREVLDNANDALFLLERTPDGPGRYLLVNEKAVSMLGYSKEEFLTMGPRDLVPPDVQKRVMPDVIKKLISEGHATFESVHRRKDGSTYPIEVSTHTFRYRGRDVDLSITRDITDRKQAEEALRESEERFNAFMSNLPAVAFVKNADGRTVFANPYLQDLFNMKNYEGKTTPELIPGDAGYRMSEDDRKVLSEGLLKVQETVKDATGASRTFETIKFPIHIAGKQVLLGGISLDISERRKIEDALRQANRQLNLLTSITRHDIRNQLLSLKAYLALSIDTVNDPEKTLAYITREQDVANAIERQILFTREYEDLGINPPVWQNVAQCIGTATREIDLTGVELETSDLKDLEIMADPLLRKVFFNLVDNALRHGGDAMTRIQVSLHKSGKGLTISFGDNGSGIPGEEKEMIFERGYGKNTGYGLSLIREILANTGITISETGEPGRGARFEMNVPTEGYRYSP
jgi:PAS domain S-box-containing protein